MAISGVNPKCYILALFVRDDGARFLLGDDPFEFKDNQLHFQQNTMANDVVEVQGNDGYLLAGQVRRPGTQVFDGYVCNGTNSKEEVEVKRRSFLQFFRRSHFYKVIYVFPNGTAIQRKQGFLVDDPTVQELYQQYPEYHVALNFEDVNYYTYEEDDQGHEIYAKEAIVPLARGGATGGLIWDSYGVVWEDAWSLPLSISGVQFQILNNAGARAPIENVELYGDTYQQTYSGKNLCGIPNQTFTHANVSVTIQDGEITLNGTANTSATYNILPIYSTTLNGTYTTSLIYVSGNISNTSQSNLNVRYSDTTSIVSGSQATIRNENSYRTWSAENANVIFGLYLSNGTVYNNVKFKYQITAGSSPDYSYEPYTNGPAPNPDYPQDIDVVTGEQTVEVCGKNLFDKNHYNLLEAYWGGTSTEMIAFPGSEISIYIKAKPNTTYTVSKTLGERFRLATTITLPQGGTPITNKKVSDTASSITITTGPNDKYLSVQLRQANDASTFADVIATLQIEEGETATTYEPYTGQTFPISLTGKNLFNVSATPTYLNGVSVSGNIQVTATSSGTNKYALYRLVEAKNYVGSKVCVSCSVMQASSTNDARLEIGLCNADGTSKSSKASTNNVNIKPTFTVTDDPDKPYIYVALYASSSVSASVGDYVGYGKVMVNRGSTPGTYAAYSPIELAEISTYQDYIYQSEGDWYVHKEIGYIDLATQTWGGAGSQLKPTTTITDIKYVSSNQEVGVGLAEKYILRKASGMSGAVGYIAIDTSAVRVNTGDASITPTGLFYYALATATDTKITDATLVGQLEALGAMKLFIGENNVLVSAPTPNLPATLAFDYFTKFAAIGAEWEEGGTKGATIVNVDAIDNTYPVWELTGPATNPTLSVLTTNTALTYNGTITGSQKLVIDMFNKTATLNGTSVIGNISGDFVYMAPGTNRLAYTAGNTDAPDSTIYWQEVVG